MEITKFIQIFMIKLLQYFIGPLLYDLEVNHYACIIERRGRQGDLDDEIMAVQFFTGAADFFKAVGSGERLRYCYFVHVSSRFTKNDKVSRRVGIVRMTL